MRSAVFTTIIGGLLVSASSAAYAQHGGHSCDPDAAPESLLSVGDFDGNGVVSSSDINLISAQVGSGEYVAFFDLNADGKLNGRDVSLAARAMGQESSSEDQQLSDLYWASEMYRDVDNAIAAGFRPFTQVLKGHGQHYARLPFMATPTGLDPAYDNILDPVSLIGEPEGLNYDENGRLVAVFYYHGIDIKDWVFANVLGDAAAAFALFNQSVSESWMSAASGGMYPHLYDSHEATWHQHWGGCWDGLDYTAMAFDPSIVPQFNQHMFPQECTAQGTATGRRQGYIPAFNMLHVWLYDLNPCGTYAGTHPDVSSSFPPEPEARPLHHWFGALGIANPYGASH